MVQSPRVARINVAPVKSLRLHHPDAIRLEPHGATDDRRFLLVDDLGRIYNGSRDTTLVLVGATWDSTARRLAMTLPEGAIIEGEVVRGPSTAVVIYGRRVRGHVVEGPWAGALSDLVGRQLTLVERDDAGWATDLRPATLVSQASLGVIDGDGRRFRMLLEVDSLEAFEEEQWRNRRVRVGEAMLLITDPMPRCAVPSANPDTGRRDRNVLRELVDRRDPVDGEACLGVCAEVLRPGEVRVGDDVEAVVHRSTAALVDRIRLSSRRLRRVALNGVS